MSPWKLPAALAVELKVRVFALLDVHVFDQAILDGEDMPYLAIRKDSSTEALDKLMNSDIDDAALPVDQLKGFHVWIKLLPLMGPVGPDLFFPEGTPAF